MFDLKETKRSVISSEHAVRFHYELLAIGGRYIVLCKTIIGLADGIAVVACLLICQGTNLHQRWPLDHWGSVWIFSVASIYFAPYAQRVQYSNEGCA